MLKKRVHQVTPQTKLEVLEDWVIIKPLEPDKITPGGIHVSRPKEIRPTRGVVVGIGPGAHHWNSGIFVPTTLQPGDVVFMKGYGCRFLDLDDEELVCWREHDLLGRLENK